MAMLAQAASNRSPTVIKREQGTKNMLGTKNKAGLAPTSNNSVPPARMTHPKLTPNPRATRSEAEAVAPGIPVESTNIDVDGANDGMDESWNKGMTHGANDAMDATGGTRPRTANTPTAAAAVIADAPDKQTVVDGNEANQRTTPVAPPARVFAVAGMSCGGCTTAVCAVVLALPGTDSVQVSLESNSVRVRVPKLAYDDTCLPATATLPPPHSSPRTPPARPVVCSSIRLAARGNIKSCADRCPQYHTCSLSLRRWRPFHVCELPPRGPRSRSSRAHPTTSSSTPSTTPARLPTSTTPSSTASSVAKLGPVTWLASMTQPTGPRNPAARRGMAPVSLGLSFSDVCSLR